MKVIVIAIQKGGTGKTTTARHLAHALGMMGRRVLLMDLDPQATASRRYNLSQLKGTLADVLGAGVEPTMTLPEIIMQTYQRNVWLAPGDERLADSDDRLARVHGGEYAIDLRLRDEPLPFDYVILDTAPGKSMLLMAALVAADELIIPVQLTAEGFEGFDAINRSVGIARQMQSIRGQVRLTYRAVLPTFYSEIEVVSQSYLEALKGMVHPDYPSDTLPLAPTPVLETTAFQQAAAVIKHNGERRARTIFDMPRRGEDTPTARGQDAYFALAQMVDAYV